MATARRPATSPSRKPPTRYHHGDLRRALVEEAVRTIAAQGVEGLTLREAGRRLGVSRTALYRHFPSKAALLAAVARDGFQRFARALAEARDAGGITHASLERMGVAYVEFALANPSHYRVMFGNFLAQCEEDPDLTTEARASFQVLVDAVTALQQRGVLRRDDPQHLAYLIWATVHGVAMLAIDGQLGPDARTTARMLIDVAHRRLGTGILAR